MAKTIQEIIDYVDEIDENKYSPKIKTVWLNEVEGIIQSQVLDVPEWAARYYVYAAEEARRCASRTTGRWCARSCRGCGRAES